MSIEGAEEGYAESTIGQGVEYAVRRGAGEEEPGKMPAVATEPKSGDRSQDGGKEQGMGHAAMSPEIAIAYTHAKSKHVEIRSNRAQDYAAPEYGPLAQIGWGGLPKSGSYQSVRDQAGHGPLLHTTSVYRAIGLEPVREPITIVRAASGV